MLKPIYILGVDLISGISCEAPYKWSEKTDTEWEFKTGSDHREEFHVSTMAFMTDNIF